ncbi:sigma 54-interacting transcriptional regulator [Desulfobacula sp.]|uniref:sigma-54-dependent Fis family transcriptional regulator n=1 Tax=Desulfobacula sp. TaxID=2593537 RepID=UPI0026264425|nr:sigma 54-interacting transcriptional regulator [Desulfobacula sp.]
MDCIDVNFYRVLFEDLDPGRLRKRFLKLLLTLQNVERGSIWIRQKDRYVCVESLGGPSKIDIIKGASISVKHPSIVGWVMTHGEMTIAEVGNDQRHYQEFETDMQLKSTLILAFPLIFKNKEVYGVVQIVDTSAGSGQLNLDKQYLRLLKGIVDMGAIALDNALQHTEQVKRNVELEQTLDEIRNKIQIIGQSTAFQKAMKNVREYARTDFPVLITGESGTGKDLVAMALHNLSSRKKEPFVVQNCSAIPETLLESELFGYQKGAFTGANENKCGLLMAANRGTVFMDEIGDMSLNLQARILRVIQNNEIKPLGASNIQKVDVRIISATNKDLNAAIKAKAFREDLFYRLNVLPLSLPPLRERKKDIPLLLNYFIKRESLELDIPPKQISSEALKYLVDYPWYGNIRELENFVKYILSTGGDMIVTLKDIPDHFKQKQAIHLELGNGRPYTEKPVRLPDNASLERADISLTDYSWEELEKEYILQLLAQNNWIVTRAANTAKINRSTFDSRMKKLGIKK